MLQPGCGHLMSLGCSFLRYCHLWLVYHKPSKLPVGASGCGGVGLSHSYSLHTAVSAAQGDLRSPWATISSSW